MASSLRERVEFAEFATALTPRMFRKALLLCGEWHLAEDLVQTTWTNLYRSWRKVDRADNPAAYALAALTKTFLSHKRSRSSSERPQLVVIDQAQSDPDLATRMAVLDALSKLGTLDRTIIVLRYWEDQSVEQTAAAVGLNPGAVKTRSHRALTVLRKQLTSMEEEAS
jgi:RNA polymerase sigma-70 factor (sigma-E family)